MADNLMDVLMPDGSTIKDVPPGTNQDDLMQRYILWRDQSRPEGDPRPSPVTLETKPDEESWMRPTEPQPELSWWNKARLAAETRSPPQNQLDWPVYGLAENAQVVTGVETALRRFTDNVLNLPETVANLGLTIVGSDRRVDLPLPDMDDIAAIGLGLERFNEAHSRVRRGEWTPDMGERPALNTNLFDFIQDERDRLRSAVTAQREQYPGTVKAADFIGDIMSVLTGRAVVGAGKGVVSVAQAAPIVAAKAQTMVARALSALSRSSRRTAGHAALTATEGAFLAQLQGSDPKLVAAYGAGAQVAGDMLMPVWKKLALHPIKGIGGTLLIAGSAALAAKQFTPGGLDRILPTIEQENFHIWLAIVFSGGAVLATGKIPPNFAGPAFAEITNVVRRGALLSLLGSIAKDPENVLPVVNKFSENSDYFGSNALPALKRAIDNSEVDISNTIRLLRKNDPIFESQFVALGNNNTSPSRLAPPSPSRLAPLSPSRLAPSSPVT